MDDTPDDYARPEPPAADRAEVERRHHANRLAWNEGAMRYTDSLEDAIGFIRAGQSSLHPIERRNLGDRLGNIRCAVHLQCASGRDTLSLWNEGAGEVVGVDISDVHIANAQKLSVATGAPARWFCCDLLDIPGELDGSADLVFTGRGSVSWIHDLGAWARVVVRLLEPGGVFHIFDDHPLLWILNENDGRVFYQDYDYFTTAESSQGWPATYIGPLDKPVSEETRKFERLWPLATIVQSLIDAGLVIRTVDEHPDEYWDVLPGLTADQKRKLPMTFSILAKKPA